MKGAGGGASQPSLDAVLERCSPAWMAVPGVVGTGASVCEGRPCIKVFVVERTPEVVKQIPENVEGYPVVVEVTGVVRPRS